MLSVSCLLPVLEFLNKFLDYLVENLWGAPTLLPYYYIDY
jgi:hypothetical protein